MVRERLAALHVSAAAWAPDSECSIEGWGALLVAALRESLAVRAADREGGR
jgi:hypothetical protein